MKWLDNTFSTVIRIKREDSINSWPYPLLRITDQQIVMLFVPAKWSIDSVKISFIELVFVIRVPEPTSDWKATSCIHSTGLRYISILNKSDFPLWLKHSQLGVKVLVSIACLGMRIRVRLLHNNELCIDKFIPVDILNIPSGDHWFRWLASTSV